MSRSLDLRNLLVQLSNLDVYDPDSITAATYLLVEHFDLYPEHIEATLGSLADYFRKNQFMSELLASTVNRIKYNTSTLELEAHKGISAFNALGDLAVFGPAPTDVDELITKLENVSREPDVISMAPGISMDLIRQWLINRQPYSQNVGFVLKIVDRFQKAFEYNPIRLAIINKAFSLLSDHASRDSNLLGWMTYSLNYVPKLYKIGEISGSSLNDVIPEFDEICERLDTIDKNAPNADASAMLILAKWIHTHASENIEPAKTLFNALSERYRDDEKMVIVLNTALKSMYELGPMTDDAGILRLIDSKPLPFIGPALSECETLREQLEFWLADGNIHGAHQLISGWADAHNRLLTIHPEVKDNMFNYLRSKFDSTPDLKIALAEVFQLTNFELTI